MCLCQAAQPSGVARPWTAQAKRCKLAAAPARSVPTTEAAQIDRCGLSVALATLGPKELAAVLCAVEKPS